GRSFELVGDAYIVVINGSDGSSEDREKGNLSIIEIKTGLIREIPGVSSFRVHSESYKIAYVVRGQDVSALEIVDARLFDQTEVVSSGKGLRFSSLTWDELGASLAFVSSAGNGQPNSVGFYLVGSRDTPADLLADSDFAKV